VARQVGRARRRWKKPAWRRTWCGAADDAIRRWGRSARERGGSAAAKVPKMRFTATLTPVISSAAWTGCNFLARPARQGVLADDMGLGKTVQKLAHSPSKEAAG